MPSIPPTASVDGKVSTLRLRVPTPIRWLRPCGSTQNLVKAQCLIGGAWVRGKAWNLPPWAILRVWAHIFQNQWWGLQMFTPLTVRSLETRLKTKLLKKALPRTRPRISRAAAGVPAKGPIWPGETGRDSPPNSDVTRVEKDTSTAAA